MNDCFNFNRLTEEDQQVAQHYIGSISRPPDLVIAPEGVGEYLFRWYVVPRNKQANVYFHIQTESDPERPLHDHPWDNTSVILAGGYDEIIDERPMIAAHHPRVEHRRKGDVIHRACTTAHRLIRPDDIPYTMSLFLTGPKVREWGFWKNGDFMPFQDITIEADGKSSWKGNMA